MLPFNGRVVRSTRPPRRRGFPADLCLGFYLFADERMTYVSVDPAPDRLGWWNHNFVTFDGRLSRVLLPEDVQLFVWPAGLGPRPVDSVCSRTTIWGRVPPKSLHGSSPAVLGRLHRLWHRFGQSSLRSDQVQQQA